MTALEPDAIDLAALRPLVAVVPIRRWDAVALKAFRFAFAVTPRVTVVRVMTGEEPDDDLRGRWSEIAERPAQLAGLPRPELVILRSEYRELFAPLIDYVSKLAADHPDEQVAVVLPELVERRWYQYLIHGKTAAVLKAALFFQGGPQLSSSTRRTTCATGPRSAVCCRGGGRRRHPPPPRARSSADNGRLLVGSARSRARRRDRRGLGHGDAMDRVRQEPRRQSPNRVVPLRRA